MTLLKQIEKIYPEHGAKGIARIGKLLGYTDTYEQLYFPDGSASATNLMNFLDDNPGACEAIIQWVMENGCTSDGERIDDAQDEEEEEE